MISLLLIINLFETGLHVFSKNGNIPNALFNIFYILVITTYYIVFFVSAGFQYPLDDSVGIVGFYQFIIQLLVYNVLLLELLKLSFLFLSYLFSNCKNFPSGLNHSFINIIFLSLYVNNIVKLFFIVPDGS
ncbi:hypothetical protein ES703_61624 [subsurface metagenome]